MYYCEHCHILCQEELCPICGTPFVRTPYPEDYCLLIEKGNPWSDLLEGALAQSQIPYIAEPTQGAGVSLYLGTGTESYRIFVPFERLPEAQEMVAELFSESEDS